MPFSGKERIKGTGKHQQSNILAADKEEFLQKTESSFGKRIRDIPAMIVSVLPRSARFFLFSWLLYSLTVFPAPPLHADEVNVILIGGQSNATGQGYVNNIPPCFKTDKRILLYYSGSLKGTEPAEQLVPLSPASESPDRFGVELSLGTALQKKFPQKKWAIIKHARSGSNLFRQWNPGKTSQDKQGEEYVKLLRTVRNGMEALKKQGHAPVLKAMVWQQGEGDARDIAGIKNALSYGANLNNLIKRIRADLEAPGLAFIYGSVLPVPAPARFPGREKVRQGKSAAGAKGCGGRIPYLLLRQQCALCPRRRSPAAQHGLPHPLSHGYRPSGHAWSSSPGRTLCLRIGKALETKKLTPLLFFSSPLSPAPSGKPIMFDIPPGCG